MTDIAPFDPSLDPPGEPRIVTRENHSISRGLIDPDVLKILYRLSRHGHRACLVGGSVRDLLLGRTPKDFDIGTDATPSRSSRIQRSRDCRLRCAVHLTAVGLRGVGTDPP